MSEHKSINDILEALNEAKKADEKVNKDASSESDNIDFSISISGKGENSNRLVGLITRLLGLDRDKSPNYFRVDSRQDSVNQPNPVDRSAFVLGHQDDLKYMENCCECPLCGYRIAKGVIRAACYDISCPRCGAPMKDCRPIRSSTNTFLF